MIWKREFGKVTLPFNQRVGRRLFSPQHYFHDKKLVPMHSSTCKLLNDTVPGWLLCKFRFLCIENALRAGRNLWRERFGGRGVDSAEVFQFICTHQSARKILYLLSEHNEPD